MKKPAAAGRQLAFLTGCSLDGGVAFRTKTIFMHCFAAHGQAKRGVDPHLCSTAFMDGVTPLPPRRGILQQVAGGEDGGEKTGAGGSPSG